MKKQTKIIIGVVIIVVAVILVISFLYPPVFKGLTSGTFGRVEKYRKQQMTEKDIQLRSEFVNDTGQLRSMIQGLIYFSLFTQELSYTIDTCVRSFQEHGICTQQNNTCHNVSLLEDYSVFIKNNNKTLSNTIRMLTDFYLKDTTDQSVDVEKNIRDFGNYVNQLNQRDSVVEDALHSMDNYMLGPAMKQVKQTELAQVKSIRDQLLMKGVQLASLLQDKPLCSNLIGYALSSNPQLCAILGYDNLQMELSSEAYDQLNIVNLGSNLVGDKPLGLVSDGQLGYVVSSQSQDVKSYDQLNESLMQGAIVVYDKPQLQFAVSSISDLKSFYSSQVLNNIMYGSNSDLKSVAAIAYSSSEGLKSILQSVELQGYLSNQLSNMVHSAELGQVIFGSHELGVVSLGNQFVSAVDQLNNIGSYGSLPGAQ